MLMLRIFRLLHRRHPQLSLVIAEKELCVNAKQPSGKPAEFPSLSLGSWSVRLPCTGRERPQGVSRWCSCGSYPLAGTPLPRGFSSFRAGTVRAFWFLNLETDLFIFLIDLIWFESVGRRVGRDVFGRKGEDWRLELPALVTHGPVSGSMLPSHRCPSPTDPACDWLQAGTGASTLHLPVNASTRPVCTGTLVFREPWADSMAPRVITASGGHCGTVGTCVSALTTVSVLPRTRGNLTVAGNKPRVTGFENYN